MADLSTTFMGIKLANPIIVGASGLTSNLQTIREVEANGAGALVTKSLFEEQIQLESLKFDADLEKYNYRNAEMIEVFPHMVCDKPDEHLWWVRKAKQAVGIPVFASLNAISRNTWIEYAQRLADTGVDGLEINLFASPRERRVPASVIEQEQIELVAELKKKIAIPIGVKLSSFYTNIQDFVIGIDEAGADAVVLFNRLFEPDIDVATAEITSPFAFSRDPDYRLPLRHAALLEGAIRADICCSNGIATGDQAIKMILAGATAVQVVSTLYNNGLAQLRTLQTDMQRWMEQHSCSTLADFRGRLSQRHAADPWAYTRAQYARILMNPDRLRPLAGKV